MDVVGGELVFESHKNDLAFPILLMERQCVEGFVGVDNQLYRYIGGRGYNPKAKRDGTRFQNVIRRRGVCPDPPLELIEKRTDPWVRENEPMWPADPYFVSYSMPVPWTISKD